MKKKNRPVRYRIEYAGFLLIAGMVRLIPRRLIPFFGSLAGELIFRILATRRQIAIDNIKASLGYTGKEAYQTAKRTFHLIGEHFLDFIKTAADSPETVRKRYHVEGWEHFQKALENEKGVILIGFHFGKWELQGMFHAAIGQPTSVLGRPLDNPFLDQWVSRAREKFGMQIINSKHPSAIRTILSILHKKGTVGFLIDQNVRGDRGVFIDFFGRLAYTHKVIALVARKTDSPVIPTFIRREGVDKFRLTYGEPLSLVRTQNRNRDIITNTQIMTRVLEKAVREEPSEWFWMHNRWKKTPKEAKGAVFLDRDGTISKDAEYLKDPQKLELLPGSAQAIRRLNESGWKVFVVTNQSGVARGFFSEEDVRLTNSRLVDLLKKKGSRVDDVFFCPHHPIEGNTAYTRNCECRKPSSGMLVWAANAYPVRLDRSFIVGDKLTDVALAHRVGAQGILVKTGSGEGERCRVEEAGVFPDAIVPDLEKAVEWILNRT